MELGPYEHLTAQTLYDLFVLKGADIGIGDKSFTVNLKKNESFLILWK
jgi:hypothetical protein